MGIYLNPGNSGFQEIRRMEYVDKSGLIDLINQTIGTVQKLTCISRPRRFGKSFTAKMLCAYYDRSCDSDALFCDLQIAEKESYARFLNQFNVIYLDMTNILGKTDPDTMLDFIQERIVKELKEVLPDLEDEGSFDETLARAAEITGIRFIMIIDEWDAPIRETPRIQDAYLRFLRMLFKSSATTSKIFAAAYMTGILPIKKDGSQSAVSDFAEYTMLNPRMFDEYVGFTEKEVRGLCKKHQADFEKMEKWYDGYYFRGIGAVYNPNSVMKAIQYHDFDSYWTQTSAAESLMDYISRDYAGLTKTVAELIGGVEVRVNTDGFANDLTTFKGKDDVLTLLIHLGYLAYDSKKRTARIPNEEIRLEFSRTVREIPHEATISRLRESDRLFYDTIHGNEEAVAAAIEKIHLEETSPLHYNREDSLRSVIKLAYYTYKDHYLQWEELPAGAGYADIVYLPRRNSDYPALVIELKWKDSAEGAIDQILSRNYPQALERFGGDILLVGINYDKNASASERRHTCRIQRVRAKTK